MRIENDRLALVAGDALSMTRTVKLKVPVCVGTPQIRPVVVFNESPGGNDPFVTDHVNGSLPPDVVIVVE